MNILADPRKLTVVGEMFASGGFKQVFSGIYDNEFVALSVFNGCTESILKSEPDQSYSPGSYVG